MVISLGVDTHQLNQYSCCVFTDPVPFPSQLSRFHAVEIVDHSSSSFTGSPFYIACGVLLLGKKVTFESSRTPDSLSNITPSPAEPVLQWSLQVVPGQFAVQLQSMLLKIH